MVAILSAVTGTYVMTLVMSATSLSMHVLFDYSLFATTSTVQVHIVCMFLPGIFTGHLMDALGKVNTILTGLLLFAGSIAVGMSGSTVYHFVGTLSLLGLGWNFTYLGGTRLLVEGYAENEAGKVEGVNEALVQASGAIAAFGSGWLVGQGTGGQGWDAVLHAAWPLIFLDIAAVVAFKVWRVSAVRAVKAGEAEDAVPTAASQRDQLQCERQQYSDSDVA
jgi:MFS family permease